MDKVIAELAVKIAAQTAQFNTALKQTQTQFSAFTNKIKNLAGSIGIAFGIQQISSFAIEISKLAGEAKGVSDAFKRLENSERLLIRLKEATGDTVSELDLMKRAVQASNFGIALESLPQLLQFAAIRAQQTGQSVDYLVDSIITGIGRKSPLILDNLGISAIRLKEQFNGASLEAQNIGDVAKAVGRIAEEELKKMGKFSENASSKFQRLSAETTNLKVALGTASNNTDVLGNALDDLILIIQNLTNLLQSDAAIWLNSYIRLLTIVPRTTLKIGNATLEFINNLSSLETAVKDFNDEFSNSPFAGVVSDTKEYNDALADLERKANLAGKKVLILTDELGKTVAVIKPFTQTVNNIKPIDDNVIISIDTLNAKLKDLTDQFRSTDVADKARLITLAQSIIATRQQIEELEKLLKLEQNHTTGLEGLRSKLAELNKEFENADINDKKRLNSISQEILAITSLIDSLERLRKKRDESNLVTTKVDTGKLTDPILQAPNFAPFKTFFDQYHEALQKLRNSLTDMQGYVQKIDITGPIIQGVVSLSEALGEAVAGVGNFGEAIIKSVANFAKQLGALLIATGFAKIAFDTFKGPAMVAAGIALVAAASAVSALMSKSSSAMSNPNGGSSSSGSSLNRITETTRAQQIALTVEPFAIRGSDIYLILKNYNNNSNYTSSING